MAPDALEGEVETIADLVVCAATLVDGLPPPSVDADLDREDEVGANRARKVIEGRCLFGRDLSDNLD